MFAKRVEERRRTPAPPAHTNLGHGRCTCDRQTSKRKRQLRQRSVLFSICVYHNSFMHLSARHKDTTTRTPKDTCIHRHRHRQRHMHIHECIYTCIYTYADIHTYIHICMHKHLSVDEHTLIQEKQAGNQPYRQPNRQTCKQQTQILIDLLTD